MKMHPDALKIGTGNKFCKNCKSRFKMRQTPARKSANQIRLYIIVGNREKTACPARRLLCIFDKKSTRSSRADTQIAEDIL